MGRSFWIMEINKNKTKEEIKDRRKAGERDKSLAFRELISQRGKWMINSGRKERREGGRRREKHI